MTLIEEEAQHLGYHQLYIETFDNLDAAIGLYKHVGFKQIDNPLAPMSHSAYNVLMIKDI